MRPELTRHDAQLRELALRLVADEHLAADLVQETYVTALERGDLPAKPRRWLRETLRLKARHARSSLAARATRERAVARFASSTTEGNGAANGNGREAYEAALAVLREELAGLEEPYRSTLRARFVDGEPPRRIAARLGLPVRTVNTRVTRGVRKLRERLDRRLGSSWAFALARFARETPETPSAPRPLSRLRVHAGLGGVAAAALALVLVATRGAREPATLSGGAAPDAELVATATPELAEPTSALRARAPVAPPAPRAATEETLDAARLHGRVVDLDGRPLAGVEVVLDEGRCRHDGLRLQSFSFEVSRAGVARATTDADGRFAIDGAALTGGEASGRLAALGAGLAPVIAEVVPTPGGAKPLELVAAPERTIAGRVTDEAGLPVEDARVTALPPDDYLAGLARRERTWVPVLPEARTDTGGGFELVAFDAEAGRLEVAGEGCLTASVTLPPGSREVAVVLRRDPAAAAELRGRVVDEAGAPLADALVVAGDADTRTDADGRFRLGPGGLGAAREVWAVAADRCPRRATLARTATGALVEPEVRLVLDRPSRAIEGRVVDAVGRPLPGARVWCADATHLGGVRSTIFAEREMLGEGEWGMPYVARADDDGRFRIPGLAERDYRIGAIELASRVSAVSAPVPAGTEGLLLRLPTDEPPAPAAGLVLDREGRPLAGVRVTAKRATLDAGIGAGGRLSAALAFETHVTDEDGWFLFEELPRAGLHLVFEGGEVLPDRLDVPADASRERLEVVLARRSRLRVRMVTGRRVDHVALVDRAGLKLPIFDAAQYASNSGYGVRTDVAVQGRDEVLVVAPDTAVALVAYGGGRIVERVPVELTPDGTLELDL